MLALDDPLWGSLQHAYGDARDVPVLLRALAASPEPQEDPEAEPWFSLWSSLCHQGDAHTASYAAVPHLVEIGGQFAGQLDFNFLLLPTAIEVARRTGRGPALPAVLGDAYLGAIARLPDLVSLHRHEPWGQAMLLSAAAAQAVAKGHIDVAEALMNLDDDWIGRINRGEFD